MSAKILSGKEVAATLREGIAAAASACTAKGTVPGLGVVLVGDDPASRSYVSAKEKACTDCGIYSQEIHLPADAARDDILAAVEGLNENRDIHGILVQLPLPDSSIEREVITTIRPEKDVDGFHPVNVGRMVLGLPAFLPCTPHGVLHLIRHTGVPLAGAEVVIIGRSQIVGQPLAILLSRKWEMGNATVTLCHTRTRDLTAHTRRADIVVAAAGRPGTLTGDMIRDGAVVIDVGVNRIPDASRKSGFRLVGDADFDSCAEKAAWITPVPGGVGPMTITMLLHNVVQAAGGVVVSDR